MDLLDRFLHYFNDLFFRTGWIEVQHGGDALGNGLRGDHDDFLVRQRITLFRSHDDVLVVGKNKYCVGIGLVDLFEDVIRRRVHGLTAGDDGINAEFTE